MINGHELRPGNYLMQKIQGRIMVTKCSWEHFHLLSKGDGKDLYPIVLNPAWLEKCGFRENAEYPLLPEAREFRLTIPVQGGQHHEICAYIKNNKECFGRAVMDKKAASNNIYHLHQLQNLFFALTGEELAVKQ